MDTALFSRNSPLPFYYLVDWDVVLAVFEETLRLRCQVFLIHNPHFVDIVILVTRRATD